MSVHNPANTQNNDAIVKGDQKITLLSSNSPLPRAESTTGNE